MIKHIADWLTLDEHGIQMPWYTRPCLEWLDTLDLKGKRVFEYGTGKSAMWYASRSAEVCGVDSNEEWFQFAQHFGNYFLADNEQDYIYEVYSAASDYHESNPVRPFDLIIIDGDHRDECTEHALKCLKPGGILIIDNWEQPSVEPNDWTRTKELINDMKQVVYKEPTHPDWSSLVVFP